VLTGQSPQTLYQTAAERVASMPSYSVSGLGEFQRAKVSLTRKSWDGFPRRQNETPRGIKRFS
jgi:hypothetical protein